AADAIVKDVAGNRPARGSGGDVRHVQERGRLALEAGDAVRAQPHVAQRGTQDAPRAAGAAVAHVGGQAVDLRRIVRADGDAQLGAVLDVVAELGRQVVEGQVEVGRVERPERVPRLSGKGRSADLDLADAATGDVGQVRAAHVGEQVDVAGQVVDR